VTIISKGRIIANEPIEKLLDLFGEEYYQIKVDGRLPVAIAERFDELTVEEENGTTILSGPIADQDTLHHILDQLREMDLPLLAASRVEPDLEEVFVRMLDTDTTQGGLAE
jgi:ABC-2 type transport system ATP-binding protein